MNRLNRQPMGNDEQPDKFLKIRNILNTIFVIGAVIGLIVYFAKDETIGTYIILFAMAFKFIECGFRLTHR